MEGWGSTEPPVDPVKNEPVTTDALGNDIYIGDDVFSGNDEIFSADNISYETQEVLKILGFEKGEYRNA